MKLLGITLSGTGLPFVSANFTHNANGGGTGTVACETQEQCDAVAAWASREGWDIATRVATAKEVTDAKYWSNRW